MMQLIADDADPRDMQVVSFHPGSVLSDTVRSAGFDETSKDWDDGKCLTLQPSPFPQPRKN